MQVCNIELIVADRGEERCGCKAVSLWNIWWVSRDVGVV